MNFPFFASFILFIIFLALWLRRSSRKEAKANEAYWEKELQANSTRRKSLDSLSYVSIPFDTLPMDILSEDPEMEKVHQTLHTLSQSRMVNFSGKTNTELKLEYGAPNINLLSEYDQNFTELIITLNKWASLLIEHQETAAARTVLEFAVNVGSDINSTYKMLADIYLDHDPDKITVLISKAKELPNHSGKKERLTAMLESMDIHTLLNNS